MVGSAELTATANDALQESTATAIVDHFQGEKADLGALQLAALLLCAA